MSLVPYVAFITLCNIYAQTRKNPICFQFYAKPIANSAPCHLNQYSAGTLFYFLYCLFYFFVSFTFAIAISFSSNFVKFICVFFEFFIFCFSLFLPSISIWSRRSVPHSWQYRVKISSVVWKIKTSCAYVNWLFSCCCQKPEPVWCHFINFPFVFLFEFTFRHSYIRPLRCGYYICIHFGSNLKLSKLPFKINLIKISLNKIQLLLNYTFDSIYRKCMKPQKMYWKKPGNTEIKVRPLKADFIFKSSI